MSGSRRLSNSVYRPGRKSCSLGVPSYLGPSHFKLGGGMSKDDGDGCLPNEVSVMTLGQPMEELFQKDSTDQREQWGENCRCFLSLWLPSSCLHFLGFLLWS